MKSTVCGPASCRPRRIRDPQTGDRGDAPRPLSQARLLRAGRDRDGRRTFRRQPAALRISRRRPDRRFHSARCRPTPTRSCSPAAPRLGPSNPPSRGVWRATSIAERHTAYTTALRARAPSGRTSTGDVSGKCRGPKRTNATVGLLTESVVCTNPKIEMTGRC